MFKFAGQAGAVSREPKEAVAKYCVGAENVAVEVHNVSTEINHLEKTEKTQGSQISQQPQNINQNTNRDILITEALNYLTHCLILVMTSVTFV